MYGLGLMKGLGVTMKNMILPSRMFTLHQYPNRKIGVLGLAKKAGTNVFSYAAKRADVRSLENPKSQSSRRGAATRVVPGC